MGKQRKNKEPNKKEKNFSSQKQLNHYKLFSIHLIMKEDSNAIKNIQKVLAILVRDQDMEMDLVLVKLQVQV
jgi:hypothetical protein